MKTTPRRVVAAAFLWAVFPAHAMQRIAVLPAGSPAEAVKDLKQAFSALLKDSSFVEEFQKTTKTFPRYTVGPEGEKLVKRITQAPPEVKNTVRKYTESK